MKYEISTETIPQGIRKAINEKVLLLIGSGEMGVFTAQDIFSAYTGEGGLHDLVKKDFSSYHSYSKAKKEIENGQFFTPASLCQSIVDCLEISPSDLVADLCCGSGNFFNFLPEESNVFGCELDSKAQRVASFLYPKATITQGDVRFYNPAARFDYIIGNPPFNLEWYFDGGRYKSQEVFLKKCAQLLQPAGIVAFIVPESYASDDFSNKAQILDIENDFNFLAQAKLPAGAFKAMGVSKFKTKVMFLQKKFAGMTETQFQVNEFVAFTPVQIREQVIRPALKVKEDFRGRILLTTNAKKGQNDWSFKNPLQRTGDGYEFVLRKLLFEIKTHPTLLPLKNKVLFLIDTMQTQKRPYNISEEKWQEQKLTPKKLLSQVRRMIKQLSAIKRSGLKVYLDAAGIHIKTYDAATTKQINENGMRKDLPWHEIVQNPSLFYNHPLFDSMRRFRRPVEKRIALFKRQTTPFHALSYDKGIDQYLNDFRFIKNDNKAYGLSPVQHKDLSAILTRPLGSLNWQMGSGKTIAAFAWLLYQRIVVPDSYTFVLGPPISIRATWKNFLEKQRGISFTCVEDPSQIDLIAPGGIYLISFSRLKAFERALGKKLKGQLLKCNLVVDESDEISNYRSVRTRLVTKLFRKVPRKLLTTGTHTRNNLAEFYPQLSFLYNHSYLCLDRCEWVYSEYKKPDTGESDIDSHSNANINKPFPVYGGHQHFKSCFSPSRKTVFGISKHNQDIYNGKAMEEILNYTVITRKFKEVAGDGKYSITTQMIPMAPWELEVRDKLMNEFSTMVDDLYASTGNSRKDAMLRVIRQLNALILSCSRPQKFAKTNHVPTKLDEIISLMSRIKERVMMGTTTIASAQLYYNRVKEAFPNRKVWIINGRDFDVPKRQAVINEFEKSTDGILISTQQSLSSSLNVPFCNHVIIESLQYNFPRVEQYFFRTIRFDSQFPTKVYFMIYENSIEVNLLMLMLEKEKLNDFLKTKSLRDTTEVMQDFEVGEWLLSMITKKVKDDNGNIRLVTGNQKLVA